MDKRLVYILLTVFLVLAWFFSLREYHAYLAAETAIQSGGLFSGETYIIISKVSIAFFIVLIINVLLFSLAVFLPGLRGNSEGLILISYGLFILLWAAEIFMPTSTIIIDGELMEVPSSFIYWFYAALVTFVLLLLQYFLLRKENPATE